MLKKPPVADRIPHITSVHGLELVDDYFWLRKKDSPEVLEYLRQENEYADECMEDTKAFQEALYNEFVSRIKETDLSVPYLEGGYYYYTRTEKGKQYPAYCRKRGSLDSEEEMLLDLNEMAKGKTFLSLGDMEVSDDGTLLAYTTDETGFRQYTLHVLEIATRRELDVREERVTSLAWAQDNKTIYFVTENETTKRSDTMWVRTIDTPATEVYREGDELYHIGVGRTRSGRFVLLQIESSDTSECRYVDLQGDPRQLRLICAREDEHEYYPDHHGDHFYIRTNDKGRNFRLVRTLVADTGRDKWEEVIGYRPDVMIEDCDYFSRHFVIHERYDGLVHLRIIDSDSGESREITFPEPVYSLFGAHNPEFDAPAFRYGYLSMVTPNSVYEYDFELKASKLLKQTEVRGGYETSRYRTERIFAVAEDGCRIPISIVYRPDKRVTGGNPVLMEGYGSYGIPNDVEFSSVRVSLLDRGFIFAMTHIRGGGDLGKPWHDQGKMMVKKNTFTDFIACGEHLIREGYCQKDGLAITGGSAGGLLMGAVCNMRPDLFRVVMSYVPFVDVINTMLDASLPLTTGEYLEWGNPNEKPAFDYMYSYSPYDNLKAVDYPTMLIRTSYNDSQVMYWEPAKYVAKLRSLKTDDRDLLFKIKLEPGGHGGASGRYDRLKDLAFDYAFLFRQYGISS